MRRPHLNQHKKLRKIVWYEGNRTCTHLYKENSEMLLKGTGDMNTLCPNIELLTIIKTKDTHSPCSCTHFT